MTDVILIGGPTASGKSELALRLARHFGTVILSADSRQVYRGLDIGTAKPSPAERAEVPHYLLDLCDPDETYTAGRFAAEAEALIQELLPRHRPILVAGGTGLYLRALYAGLDEFPPVPEAQKKELEAYYHREGLGGLQRRLQRVDPVYSQEVDLQNPRRLMRAILVSETAGQPYSSLRRNQLRERPFTMSGIYLDAPADWLEPRIRARVQHMIEAGLEAEALQLYPCRDNPALQTVGYQEWFEFFEGKCPREEVPERIVIHTRQYAKRQRTWFGKEDWWQRLAPEPPETLTARALDLLAAKA
jgi:tRNA dimethylallyltransferase